MTAVPVEPGTAHAGETGTVTGQLVTADERYRPLIRNGTPCLEAQAAATGKPVRRVILEAVERAKERAETETTTAP